MKEFILQFLSGVAVGFLIAWLVLSNIDKSPSVNDEERNRILKSLETSKLEVGHLRAKLAEERKLSESIISKSRVREDSIIRVSLYRDLENKRKIKSLELKTVKQLEDEADSIYNASLRISN